MCVCVFSNFASAKCYSVCGEIGHCVFGEELKVGTNWVSVFEGV